MAIHKNTYGSDGRRLWHPHPQGGQHKPSAGITTLDSLSHVELVEDHRQRLADFEAALEQARFGIVAGREW